MLIFASGAEPSGHLRIGLGPQRHRHCGRRPSQNPRQGRDAYSVLVLAPIPLPEPGQPPRWGNTLEDQEIVVARNDSFDEQRKLFFGCARHLFDNQVRDHGQERNDPANDEAWLKALGAWFGWTDSQTEDVITEAAQAAMTNLPDETFDTEQ